MVDIRCLCGVLSENSVFMGVRCRVLCVLQTGPGYSVVIEGRSIMGTYDLSFVKRDPHILKNVPLFG